MKANELRTSNWKLFKNEKNIKEEDLKDKFILEIAKDKLNNMITEAINQYS